MSGIKWIDRTKVHRSTGQFNVQLTEMQIYNDFTEYFKITS